MVSLISDIIKNEWENKNNKWEKYKRQYKNNKIRKKKKLMIGQKE